MVTVLGGGDTRRGSKLFGKNHRPLNAFQRSLRALVTGDTQNTSRPLEILESPSDIETLIKSTQPRVALQDQVLNMHVGARTGGAKGKQRFKT